jgi:BNR/Asp-box repeat protein
MRIRSALVLAAAIALPVGCGGDEPSESPPGGNPEVGDPGPIHVHGLGINPKDGALFVATHTGLFRAAEGQDRPERVGDRFQDTMGFTIVGPDTFLGSGHPGGRDRLPPFLGLIRSDDGGRSWRPVSLLGERDFHVLEASGRRVYGFGSDFKTRAPGFLVSDDGGETWEQREVPEPLISLAISPRDPGRIVASGQAALYLSEGAGRRWLPHPGPPGHVAWGDELTVADASGAVHAAPDAGQRPRPVGHIDGKPAAFESGPDGELYAALHDGTIKRSDDGGRTWSIRATP